MSEPMDTTMAVTKRTRDNSIVATAPSTPNPKDRKTPRSILKGKPIGKNKEETKEKEDDEDTDEEIAAPP